MLFSWGGEQLLFRLVPPFFVPIVRRRSGPVVFFSGSAHAIPASSKELTDRPVRQGKARRASVLYTLSCVSAVVPWTSSCRESHSASKKSVWVTWGKIFTKNYSYTTAYLPLFTPRSGHASSAGPKFFSWQGPRERKCFYVVKVLNEWRKSLKTQRRRV